MAEKKSPPSQTGGKSRAKAAAGQGRSDHGLLWRLTRRCLVWGGRIVLGIAAFFLLLILLFSFVNPPGGYYQMSEATRLGAVERQWVDWDQIAPIMGRSAVAAEDANFCLHWGFDMAAIRAAVAQGGNRGASTISQQVVKNVFLWHGRSWLRKAAEAMLTPAVELFWSKQRILEIYLNVAEFGDGIFGIQAAARHNFGIDARNLNIEQAARLAAVLPDPKHRSARNPGPLVRKRAAQIASGAQTIRVDGRATCFERRN
jgi:monofunctional biosynthetic peptidoglycan transglycosylase